VGERLKKSQRDTQREAITLLIMANSNFPTQKRIHPLKGKARKRYTLEQVRAALEKTHGMVSAAAEIMQCDRDTIYAYLNKYPELKESRNKFIAQLIERAEFQIAKKVQEGDNTACIFVLKTQGKRNGWVERMELTGAEGKELIRTINVLPASNKRGK
jgi:hypothetical protein